VKCAAALCTVSFALLSSIAQARTFDFKKESFASYFRGTYGTSNAKDSTFGGAVAENVTADKSVTGAASGEFGFLFSGEKVGFRVGLEYLVPRSMTEVKFADRNENVLATANTKITALIPLGGLEFPAYRSGTARMIIGVGGGLAMVNVENQYVLTTAGRTRFGLDDFTESASGQGLLAQTYVGYEFLLTDTVTMMGDLGYRYCKVSSLKSSRSQESFSNDQTEGGDLLNADGSVRSVDLSGLFVGLGFRFYF